MENRIYTSIGMMSGTSLDGVDVALIRTDGEGHIEIDPQAQIFMPYTAETKQAIRSCFGQVDSSTPQMLKTAQMVTASYNRALEMFWAQTGVKPADVDVIGAHGQTVTHVPQDRLTIQLGDAQSIADQALLPVVFDLRQNDISQGGQGAPLLPIYHQALMAGRGQNWPVAVLNMGGVGNITLLPDMSQPSVVVDDMMAFDTGPANAYLDDWIMRKTGEVMDVGGALARSGKVDQAIVDRFLQHAYFAVVPPKSLDRGAFDFLLQDVASLSAADGAATLLECSVQAVAKAFGHFGQSPAHLYICGGGAQNAFMVERLRAVLSHKTQSTCTVDRLEDLGIAGDYIEAQGFAYMAVRSLRGLPITFKGTTGAPHALSGGCVYAPMIADVTTNMAEGQKSHG